MTSQDPHTLPDGLPVPTDDGACDHLRWMPLPAVSLRSTGGRAVDLAEITAGRAVLFFYPRTGVPGQPPNLGYAGEAWDAIPGARGCTPQSCGFRDLHDEFRALGVEVYGISTSTPEHQREFVQRNHVPFEMLSDSELSLTRAMRLPTFRFPVESGGPDTLIRRMAWYVERGRVVSIWHPVFPPDRNAATVLAWLGRRAAVTVRPIGPDDIDYVRGELCRHWHSPTIGSMGREFRADELPGFIATADGRPAGLVTYFADPDRCEIVTLSAAMDGLGIGTALLDAAVAEACRLGCRRAFLTTTNDNLRALRFYQRHGWRLVAVHRGAIDAYRAREPAIRWTGMNGIPCRDEIELELLLPQPCLGPAADLASDSPPSTAPRR